MKEKLPNLEHPKLNGMIIHSPMLSSLWWTWLKGLEMPLATPTSLVQLLGFSGDQQNYDESAPHFRWTGHVGLRYRDTQQVWMGWGDFWTYDSRHGWIGILSKWYKFIITQISEDPWKVVWRGGFQRNKVPKEKGIGALALASKFSWVWLLIM